MQYEVYLDVLFLENMMMDFLILLAVKKVFPCSATYGSLLAGSFTGSLLTCAILFFPCPVWVRYILLFFLVNSCMTVIGLKLRTFPVFLKAWILLYLKLLPSIQVMSLVYSTLDRTYPSSAKNHDFLN